MTGAEAVLDLAVILRALISIPDQEPYGCACRDTFEYAGEDLDFVGFLALGGEL